MRIFTAEHDQLLRAKYNKVSNEELRRLLNFNFSILLIDRRAKELGLTKCNAKYKEEFNSLSTQIKQAYADLKTVDMLSKDFELQLQKINNLEIKLENLIKR